MPVDIRLPEASLKSLFPFCNKLSKFFAAPGTEFRTVLVLYGMRNVPARPGFSFFSEESLEMLLEFLLLTSKRSRYRGKATATLVAIAH